MKRTEITNAGEDVKKREPYTLLVGKYIGTAAVENSMDISQKTKNRITILHTIYITPGYISEKNTNLKRCMHPNVHHSIIYSCQDTEAPKCLSMGEWIKKFWYIHSMEYYSARKKEQTIDTEQCE